MAKNIPIYWGLFCSYIICKAIMKYIWHVILKKHLSQWQSINKIIMSEWNDFMKIDEEIDTMESWKYVKL